MVVIQDETNPYWQDPNSTNNTPVQGPPAPTIGPTLPAPDAGGSGHEASFESVVAAQLQQDYPISPTQGDVGDVTPSEQSGSSFFSSSEEDRRANVAPAAAPNTLTSDFWGDPGFITPPSNSGSGYFADITKVTNQDYFGSDQGQQNLWQQATAAAGPPPTPGDGSLWFGSADDQQRQSDWWTAEYQKALGFGDSTIVDGNGAGLTGTQYAQQLRGELDHVNTLWNEYSGSNGSSRQDFEQGGPGQIGAYNARVQQSAAGILDAQLNPGTVAGEGGYRRVPVQDAQGNLSEQPVSNATLENWTAGLRPTAEDEKFWAARKAENDAYLEQQRQNAAHLDLYQHDPYGLAGLDRGQMIEGQQAAAAWDQTIPRLTPDEVTYWNQQNQIASRYLADPEAQAFFAQTGQFAYGQPETGQFTGGLSLLGQAASGAAHLAENIPLFVSPVGTHQADVTTGSVASAAATPMMAPAAFELGVHIPVPGADPTVKSILGATFSIPAKAASIEAAKIEQPLFAGIENLAQAAGNAMGGDWAGTRRELGATGQDITQLLNLPTFGNARQIAAVVTDPHAALLLQDQDSLTARAYLADHPMLDVANQTALDPFNLAGTGILFGPTEEVAQDVRAAFRLSRIGGETFPAASESIGARPLTKLALVTRADLGAKALVNRWSLKTLLADGRIEPQLVEAWANTQPSWSRVLRLNMAEQTLTRNQVFPTGVIESGYMDEWAKRVTLRADLAYASEPDAKSAITKIVAEETERIKQRVTAAEDARTAQQAATAFDAAAQRVRTNLEQFANLVALPPGQQQILALPAGRTALPVGGDLIVSPSFRVVEQTPVVSPLVRAAEEQRVGRRFVTSLQENAPQITRPLPEGQRADLLALTPGNRVRDIPLGEFAVAPDGRVVAYHPFYVPPVAVRYSQGDGAILVRSIDGQWISKAQDDAERSIRQLTLTEPPRPAAERQPVNLPTLERDPHAPTQLPLPPEPAVLSPITSVSGPVAADLATAAAHAGVVQSDAGVVALRDALDQGVHLTHGLAAGDVTLPQLHLLDLFSQRDGVDYLALLAQDATALGADGKVTFQAVSQKLTALDTLGPNGTGLATVNQLRYLAALGAPADEITRVAALDRLRAQEAIDTFLGQNPLPTPDTSGYMTIEQFIAAGRLTDVSGRPLSVEAIQEAYTRGQKYGRDFLREWAEGRSTPSVMFGYTYNEHNILASAAQQRTIRGLERAGIIEAQPKLETLRAAQARELIHNALGADPVEARLRGVDMPMEPVSPGDVRDTLRAAQMLGAQNSAADYLRQYLPRLATSSEDLAKGAGKAGYGKLRSGMQADYAGGVAIMSPMAVQDLFVRHFGDYSGTLFEAHMADAINAFVHVNRGGEASFSSAEVLFDRAMVGLEATARQNPNLDETARFVDMLRGGYHDDARVAQIQADNAAKLRQAPSPDEAAQVQRNLALYQDQGPRVAAEIERQRGLLHALQATPGADAKSLGVVQQRIDYLAQQATRMNAYMAEHAPELAKLKPGENPRFASLEARWRRLSQLYPDLPALPPIETNLYEAAGKASTIDTLDALHNGAIVPASATHPLTIPTPVVVPAGSADEAAIVKWLYLTPHSHIHPPQDILDLAKRLGIDVPVGGSEYPSAILDSALKQKLAGDFVEGQYLPDALKPWADLAKLHPSSFRSRLKAMSDDELLALAPWVRSSPEQSWRAASDVDKVLTERGLPSFTGDLRDVNEWRDFHTAMGQAGDQVDPQTLDATERLLERRLDPTDPDALVIAIEDFQNKRLDLIRSWEGAEPETKGLGRNTFQTSTYAQMHQRRANLEDSYKTAAERAKMPKSVRREINLLEERMSEIESRYGGGDTPWNVIKDARAYQSSQGPVRKAVDTTRARQVIMSDRGIMGAVIEARGAADVGPDAAKFLAKHDLSVREWKQATAEINAEIADRAARNGRWEYDRHLTYTDAVPQDVAKRLDLFGTRETYYAPTPAAKLRQAAYERQGLGNHQWEDYFGKITLAPAQRPESANAMRALTSAIRQTPVAGVSDEAARAARAEYEATQAMLREAGVSDQVTLYRGVRPNQRQGLKAGESLSFWTSNPEYAAHYATGDGQVMRAVVPRDAVVMSSWTNPTMLNDLKYTMSSTQMHGFSQLIDEWVVNSAKVRDAEAVSGGTAVFDRLGNRIDTKGFDLFDKGAGGAAYSNYGQGPVRKATLTHDGRIVKTRAMRRMLNPDDQRLLGPERARVVGQIADAFQNSSISEGEMAASVAILDELGLAATVNNPNRFPTVDHFYKAFDVKPGGEAALSKVAPGWEGVYGKDAMTRTLGTFASNGRGGGLVTLFKNGDATVFMHEVGHLMHTVLTEEQLADLERLYNIADGTWSPADLESIAKSFEAYLGGGRLPHIRVDIAQLNPGLGMVFDKWRKVIANVWRTTKDYFSATDMSREMFDFWNATLRYGDNVERYTGGTYTDRLARLMRFGPQGAESVTPRVLHSATVVDPHLSAMTNVDWSVAGPRLDSYIDKYYDHTGLLDDMRRAGLGRMNPTQLTDMSRVLKVGDLVSADLARFFSEDSVKLLRADGKTDYEAIRNRLTFLRDNDVQAIAKQDGFYGSSRHGMETLRVLKQYATDVLKNFEDLVPHQGVGSLIAENILPLAKDGRWDERQLERVHKMLNGQQGPPAGLSDVQKRAWRDFQSGYKERWNELIANQFRTEQGWNVTDPALRTHAAELSDAHTAALARAEDARRQVVAEKLNFDASGARRRNAPARANKTRLEEAHVQARAEAETARKAAADAAKEIKDQTGLHILDVIDAHLFHDDPNQISDLPKFADHIGSYVASRFATDIGFNPDSLPFGMKTAVWIKGQLTPLWMTLWPQYHVNNLAGNWMGQLAGALRSDLHIGPVPMKDQRYMAAEGRIGSSIVQHPYRRAELVGRNDLGAVGRYAEMAGRDYGPIQQRAGLPHALDLLLGGAVREDKRGLVTGAGWLANKAEDHFKDVIYSQAFRSEHNRRWALELRNLEAQGLVGKGWAEQLGGKLGADEVRQTARSLGAEGDAEQAILARYRAVVGGASHTAYTDTRTVLRDYRMRNKIDGFLDRFLPVHYWSTKNFAFMTRTALDKPFLTLNALQAFDAWQKQNADLPASLRTGYLAVPFDHPALSWIPGVTNKTWHMRLTSLTNPVLYAVPRLMNDVKTGWEQSDGGSLPMRLATAAKDGAMSFWQNSGYRVGPQFDFAVTAGHALVNNTTLKDHPFFTQLAKDAQFLVSPSLDRNLNMTEGWRTPVLQSLLPLSGITDLALRNSMVQKVGEYLNRTVYGSPYTANETQQIGLGILADEQAGKIDHATAEQLSRALWNNQLDTPGLRTYIDRFWTSRSNTYLLSRGLAASGKTYTDSWKASYEASRQYRTLADTGGRAAADRYMMGSMHPALRWLIDQRNSGAISQQQYQDAEKAMQSGEPNDLLMRAWREGNSDTGQVNADKALWMQMAADAKMYDQVAGDKGRDAANLWAFGWHNSATGQVEDAHAPWLSTYWLVMKSDRELAQQSIQSSTQKQEDAQRRTTAYAMLDDYYSSKNAQSNAAAPYYARMDTLYAAVDSEMKTATELGHDETDANGHTTRVPNMIMVNQIQKALGDGLGKIYADAQTAGVPLVSGALPKHGNTYYDTWGGITSQQQVPGTNTYITNRAGGNVQLQHGSLAAQNGALEAVDRVETEQRQRGKILDILKDELAPKLYVDGKPNPDYQVDDGQGNWHFDMTKYESDRHTAANGAVAASFDVIKGLRESGLHVVVSGITPADFLEATKDKNPQLTQWKDTRSQDISQFFAMTTRNADGSYNADLAAAKDAAANDLKAKYGADVLDKNYGNWSNADATYDAGTKAIKVWHGTLTPAQRDAFKARYGSAFTGTGNDATFVPANLSTEQVNEIVSQNHLDPFGVSRDAQTLNNFGTNPLQAQTAQFQEAGRKARTDQVYGYIDAYHNGAGLTPDQQGNLKTWYAFLDGHSDLEKAANELRGSGTPQQISWKRAASAADSAGEYGLGDYIRARMDQNATLDVNASYDAQKAWWDGLDPATQSLLLTEAPGTFGRYGPGGSASTTFTSSVPAGGSGSRTTRTTGSTARTSTARAASTSRAASGFATTGANSSSGAGASTLVLVQTLDPFFTSGADDGRGQYAQQVSDWIDGQLLSMFPPNATTKGVGGVTLNLGLIYSFLRTQMLQWAQKYLGPSPDLAAWQQLWQRLASGPTYQRAPIASPSPAQPAAAAPQEAAPTPTLPASSGYPTVDPGTPPTMVEPSGPVAQPAIDTSHIMIPW